jgi:hypothetical protein
MKERSTNRNTHARKNVHECRTQMSVSLLEHHALRGVWGNECVRLQMVCTFIDTLCKYTICIMRSP